MKPLEFFIQHIGKRIYRDDNGCVCQTCRDVVENGIVVANEDHAQYLYDNQMDFAAEGVMLNYRETVEPNLLPTTKLVK